MSQAGEREEGTGGGNGGVAVEIESTAIAAGVVVALGAVVGAVVVDAPSPVVGGRVVDAGTRRKLAGERASSPSMVVFGVVCLR